MEVHSNDNQQNTFEYSSPGFIHFQDRIDITTDCHRDTLPQKIHCIEVLAECHKDKDMPKERLVFICILIDEDAQPGQNNQAVNSEDPLGIIRKETDKLIQIKVQGFPLADDSAKRLSFNSQKRSVIIVCIQAYSVFPQRFDKEDAKQRQNQKSFICLL